MSEENSNENSVLPFKEFEAKDLGNREIARKNSQFVEAIIKIPIDKIIIREKFNVRSVFEGIEDLAQSLLENGQEQPGKVDVMADGTFVLTDGARRYKALKINQEKGYEVFFLATVNKKQTTEEQRIIQMFTTQDACPLKPFEVGRLIERLISLGWKQTDVAKKIGRTDAYVSQMLSYSREPQSVKSLVEAGTMTVTTVLDLQKKIPDQDEREKAILGAVRESKQEASNEAGEFGRAQDNTKSTKKITVEDVTGEDRKKGGIAKPSELAAAIALAYGLVEEDLSVMIDLIKSYQYIA